MAITSFTFVLFVLGALGVYYLLQRRAQNYWLLFVSYVFLVTWSWQFALVLVIVTIVNYQFARWIDGNKSGRTFLLWLGIGFNVLILIFFRMNQFFIPGLLSMLATLGVQAKLGVIQILIPIGLSYYVLETISYLVDVYRRQYSAIADVVDFALYLAYFPKLLAGPIERARSFLPKLASQRVVDNDLLSMGFSLIVIGVVRKLVFADTLTASLPPDVFVEPYNFSAPELWGWLLVYAFALYNDFAGYTSIVRGVSALFGIELSLNFKTPYLSLSISDFWNRWHITLSHWLRDYIFFPFGRNLMRRVPRRENPINLVLPPLVTMLVSGLWHGFQLNLILWGGLHGLYLVVERVRSLGRSVVNPANMSLKRQLFSMGVVFIFVVLAWVPFRMEIPVAFEYWYGLFFNWSNLTLRYRRIFFMIPFLVGLGSIDWIQYRYKDELVFLRWPRLVQAALLAGAFLLILILSQTDTGDPFVYQGF